jgi:hypothetical protein
VPANQVADSRQDDCRQQGLRDKIIGSMSERLGVVAAVGHASHDDHWKLGCARRGPKCIAHGEPIHAWQPDIEQDEIELLHCGYLQDLFATSRLDHFRTGLFEDSSQDFANR